MDSGSQKVQHYLETMHLAQMLSNTSRRRAVQGLFSASASSSPSRIASSSSVPSLSANISGSASRELVSRIGHVGRLVAVDEPLGQPRLGESGRAPSGGRGLEVTLGTACGECAAAHREGHACPRLLPLPLSVLPVDCVDPAASGGVLANSARQATGRCPARPWAIAFRFPQTRCRCSRAAGDGAPSKFVCRTNRWLPSRTSARNGGVPSYQ